MWRALCERKQKLTFIKELYIVSIDANTVGSIIHSASADEFKNDIFVDSQNEKASNINSSNKKKWDPIIALNADHV